jgi:hypothetical protein
VEVVVRRRPFVSPAWKPLAPRRRSEIPRGSCARSTASQCPARSAAAQTASSLDGANSTYAPNSGSVAVVPSTMRCIASSMVTASLSSRAIRRIAASSSNRFRRRAASRRSRRLSATTAPLAASATHTSTALTNRLSCSCVRTSARRVAAAVVSRAGKRSSSTMIESRRALWLFAAIVNCRDVTVPSKSARLRVCHDAILCRVTASSSMDPGPRCGASRSREARSRASASVISR